MNSTNTRLFDNATARAVDVANQITPSVLTVARVAGIKAKDLATEIGNGEETSLYRAEVTRHLQEILVKQAVDELHEGEEQE